jgi:NTE family protein
MTVKQWLIEEPFALAMSSGFFGFYAHLGALAALVEEDLKPSYVCGSSAGAIVTASWAAGLSVDAMRDVLFSLRRNDFWDPGLGLGLLKGRLFENKLSEILPKQNIEDCSLPLSVSVFDVFKMRAVGVTQGSIAKLVRASCSVPGLFQPVRVRHKFYIDGGLTDKAGLAGVSWRGRVLYHHLLEGSRELHKNKLPKFSASMSVCSLVLEKLPYINPFELGEGPKAFDSAYRRIKTLLNQRFAHVMQS